MTDNDAIKRLAERLLENGCEDMPPRERRMIEKIAHRTSIFGGVHPDHRQKLTFGERLADRVASFGGSWRFLMLFAAVLLGWVILNTAFLSHAFDPYPYILLNLVLSMLASAQAPIIMMSQNRQAIKDRSNAAHDYEVNLKAEIEIMALHDKLDEMRNKDLAELLRQLSQKK
jgi:uncharacterized membrane protein